MGNPKFLRMLRAPSTSHIPSSLGRSGVHPVPKNEVATKAHVTTHCVYNLSRLEDGHRQGRQGNRIKTEVRPRSALPKLAFLKPQKTPRASTHPGPLRKPSLTKETGQKGLDVQFPLMIPISLKGGCSSDGQSCSLEDLALIEGSAHVLESPLPAKVLSNQRPGLLAARIQLPPRIRLVVYLPIWTQLRKSGVKSTWSGYQTLSHTCYFQLRHTSSDLGTPTNTTAPSCTHSLNPPECPSPRSQGELPGPLPCPKEKAPPCTFLTGKASSWPRKTQTPEMELLLLVPKRMTLAKAFFLSLSNRWNIPEGARGNIQALRSCYLTRPSLPRPALFSPVMRLQLMKVWVSSSGKRYSEYHRDQPSLSKCSQKYGSATESVSSLEYLRLNSSNTKALKGGTRQGGQRGESCQTKRSQGHLSVRRGWDPRET